MTFVKVKATIEDHIYIHTYVYIYIHIYVYVTCSAILALLDRDDDLRARHELFNTERIL